MATIQRKFTYQRKPTNGMVLLSFKKEADLNKNNHPGSLSQYDWTKKFTVGKLKNTWKQKADTDFQISEQKFPFNIVTPKILESKQFVRDLLENDVLEIKKKRWNVSSQVNAKEKKDHKKRLYELKHNLISFSSTPKQRKAKAMTMIDNDCSDRERWNIKGTLEPEEKKEISNRIQSASKQNSKSFWHARRKTSAIIGDAYVSPYTEYSTDLKLLRKIREDTELQREEIEKEYTEVRYLNPGALKYPEKINAIVYKEMKGIFKEKLIKMKTNQIEKEAHKSQKKQSDAEISERIAAIKGWKESDRNRFNLFQTEVGVQDYIVPLITHSDKIQHKESEIAHKKQKDCEDALRKKKLQAMRVSNDNSTEQPHHSSVIPKSRYPINEFLLEDAKKNINFFSETFATRSVTEGNCFSSSKNPIDDSTSFISIYKKVSTDAVSHIKSKKEQLKAKYTESNKHPGTYRIFQDKDGIDHYAWSCCLKNENTSQGCQRILSRRYKWNLY